MGHLRNIYDEKSHTTPPTDATGPQLLAGLKQFITTLDSNASKVHPMDDAERWVDFMSTRVDSENHYTQPGWAAMVDNMDKVLLRSRLDKPSNRPFNNIKVLKAAEEKFYGNQTVKQGVSYVLQLREFVQNTVLILGFGLIASGKNSAHGVAVCQQNTGTFLFLVPNYGIFEYRELGDLCGALYYLFDDEDATPIYGEDGDSVTGKVSYLLLARS